MNFTRILLIITFANSIYLQSMQTDQSAAPKIQNQQTNVQNCSICCEELSDNVVQFPCHNDHKFHKSCIREWIKKSMSRPIGRITSWKNFINNINTRGFSYLETIDFNDVKSALKYEASCPLDRKVFPAELLCNFSKLDLLRFYSSQGIEGACDGAKCYMHCCYPPGYTISYCIMKFLCKCLGKCGGALTCKAIDTVSDTKHPTWMSQGISYGVSTALVYKFGFGESLAKNITYDFIKDSTCFSTKKALQIANIGYDYSLLKKIKYFEKESNVVYWTSTIAGFIFLGRLTQNALCSITEQVIKRVGDYLSSEA